MEQQLQAGGVTCILTSCGRFDLLRVTLESFFKYNTYEIAEFYIYEDSSLPVPQDLKDDFPFIKWIETVQQAGQIIALDTLWFFVKTKYAFCMEDDWEFLKEGFIEKSMEILEREPKILHVWLQPLEPSNQHPVSWGKDYGIFKPDNSLWAWHRFNPSLKRKSNYDLVAPFSKHTSFNKNKGWQSEVAISKVYNDLGFTAAILPEQYIKHIGEGEKMRIMYKFASRSRPDKLIKALENIQQFSQHDDYFIAITLDVDDFTCNSKDFQKQLLSFKNVFVLYGISLNKIDAINRDMVFYNDWDILINMSDDMEFIKYGFDKIIIKDFESFRSLDLLLHYPDQKAWFAMCTMAIMGKDYYLRDGYIYNPCYKSLFCDNEQMEIAKIRGRYKYIKTRLFNHNNPMHGLAPKDELHLKTIADHKEDKATFEKRKAEKFV